MNENAEGGRKKVNPLVAIGIGCFMVPCCFCGFVWLTFFPVVGWLSATDSETATRGILTMYPLWAVLLVAATIFMALASVGILVVFYFRGGLTAVQTFVGRVTRRVSQHETRMDRPPAE